MCGDTTYIAGGTPSAAHACHCDDCHRFAGAGFVGVNFETLEVNGPVNWFDSSEWGRRGSCSNCGSAMFWQLRSGGGPKVVTLGSLDDPSEIAPINQHYFADNIPAGYSDAGDVNIMSREETLAYFASMSPE